jgi:hypothetical protein
VTTVEQHIERKVLLKASALLDKKTVLDQLADLALKIKQDLATSLARNDRIDHLESFSAMKPTTKLTPTSTLSLSSPEPRMSVLSKSTSPASSRDDFEDIDALISSYATIHPWHTTRLIMRTLDIQDIRSIYS